MLVALLALPYSPGLDDPALYTSIYSYQHYGQLSFPDDDIPFMYKHPPTKYWAVGLLVSAGLPLRLATAGLFLASYLLVLAAATACRFTFFQHLAVLFAVPATVTLCPFISYSPENLAHGEAIGRLRPDDLVLTFWLSGLLWLEAARRERQRLWYGVAGGACIGLASVTHWFGIPALAAIVVYLAAAEARERSRAWPSWRPHRARSCARPPSVLDRDPTVLATGVDPASPLKEASPRLGGWPRPGRVTPQTSGSCSSG